MKAHAEKQQQSMAGGARVFGAQSTGETTAYDAPYEDAPAPSRAIAQLARRMNEGPRADSMSALSAMMESRPAPVQRAENHTGMPDSLKGGIEQLSGMDMSGVRVHYNSPEPEQIQAHAFTKGQDIHVAPGQEGYLPHEGWHVVQQMQGRVRPTTQAGGVDVNDDPSLEAEADRLGDKAKSVDTGEGARPLQKAGSARTTAQLGKKDRRGGAGAGKATFEQKVKSVAWDTFIDDAFAQNHIVMRSELQDETVEQHAIAEGTRRALGEQTTIFMDKADYKALMGEIVAGNASKHYYKRIKQNGGVPANSYFTTESAFYYITVEPGAGGAYQVKEEGAGQIVYTVKNVGASIDKIPLFKLNHLESMQPAGGEEAVSDDEDLVEEEQEDVDQEEVESEDDVGQFADGIFAKGGADSHPMQPKAAAPVRQSASAVAQRVITVNEKPYSWGDALSLLFSTRLVESLELANALESVLKGFDKQNLSFDSPEQMLASAMKALDEDVDEEEVDNIKGEFGESLWHDEHENLRKKNLKEMGYVRGPSLRDEQGMDYKTVDKDAFSVKDREDLALVIRMNRPKGAGSITAEIKTLRALAQKDFPVAEILEYGYYPIDGEAHPALLMRRYVSSSKTLVRRVSKQTARVEGWQGRAMEIFDSPQKIQNGLDSLGFIAGKLRSSPGHAVDDIQFLIDGNGRFVINDASQMNKSYLGANMEVIGELSQILKEWQQRIKIQEESDESDEEGGIGPSFEDIEPGLIEVAKGVFLPDYRTVGGMTFPDTGSMTDFYSAQEENTE